MSFALLTPLQQKIQVFDDVCSELAMAILQFFQVSNIAIASPHQKLYQAKEQNSEPEQTDINAEQGKPSEEHVFRCMGALSTFCAINREVGIQYHQCIVIIIHIIIVIKNIDNNPTNHCDPQVPQLVKMIGPDPSKFSGLSTRVDEQLGCHHHHTFTIDALKFTFGSSCMTQQL